MSATGSRPVTPVRLVLAWGVHLFTASGAVAGALALLWRSGSGDLAKRRAADAGGAGDRRGRRHPGPGRVGVKEVLPDIDGRRLDDMVDYLNFVIVPVVFLLAPAALPDWALGVPPILASAYGFSQADAKTDDDFFLRLALLLERGGAVRVAAGALAAARRRPGSSCSASPSSCRSSTSTRAGWHVPSSGTP